MTPDRGAGPRVINFSATTTSRSSTMYAMYEALARDRMRETRSEARQRRAVQAMTAVRRAHRLQRRADQAQQRASAAQRRNVLTTV